MTLATSRRYFSFTALASLILLGACQAGTDGAGGSESQAASADTIRVLAYNIHHGEGMDSILDLDRIAALINEVDPDFVTLQEMDSVVTRTEGVNQAEELGRLTGMQPLFGRFMAYQGGAYGMAVLSRLPVVSSTNYRLPDGDEPRSALSAIVTTDSGQELRIVGIHFYRTEEERLAQAMALEDSIRGSDIPTILAGDFNSEPGTAVMTHLAQGWTVVDKGADSFTFPSYGPEREIDYFLYRPADRFRVHMQQVLEEPVISDHRPLLIELILER